RYFDPFQTYSSGIREADGRTILTDGVPRVGVNWAGMQALISMRRRRRVDPSGPRDRSRTPRLAPNFINQNERGDRYRNARDRDQQVRNFSGCAVEAIKYQRCGKGVVG